MIKTLKMISDEGNRGRLFRIMIIPVFEALLGAIPFGVLFFVLFDIIDKTLTIDRFKYYTIIILISAVFRTIALEMSISVQSLNTPIIL